MAREYYGFGIVPVCETCASTGLWKQYSGNNRNVALSFLFNKATPLCLVENNECECTFSNKLSNQLMNDLLKLSYSEILDELDKTEIFLDVQSIPMFNDLFDGSKGMIDYMITVDKVTYLEVGTHFTSDINRIEARRKYGEEHVKLASQFGFVSLPLDKQPRITEITTFGIQCGYLSKKEFDTLLPKLVFKIPIVEHLFKEAATETISVKETMKDLGMKDTTITRRGTSIKALFRIFDNVNDEKLHERLSRIYW